MRLKKFNVERCHELIGLFGIVLCPREFNAEIKGTETMDELVAKSARSISDMGYDLKPESNVNRSNMPYWIAFKNDARIPYNNQVVDEKAGVAGFVLLYEEPTSKGMEIHEGIYGIRKDGTTLRGRLIEYDCKGGQNNNYFRHLVDKIKEGVLEYSIIRKDKVNYFYDLENL